MSKKEPKEIWEALAKAASVENAAAQMMLKIKYANVKWSSPNMKSHIETIEKLILDLKYCNVQVNTTHV